MSPREMSSSFRAVRGCLLRFEAIASSQRYWGKPTLFLIAACAVTAGWHYGVEPLENKLEAKDDYLLAEMEAARGHDLEASNDIRMALTHTRTDASMWRLAAILSQRLNSSEAAYCWRQVDWLAPGDLWTQLSCVEAATQARQLDLAAAVLNEVAEPDRPKSAFLIAAASLAEARGETAEAGREFRSAGSQTPDRATHPLGAGGVACAFDRSLYPAQKPSGAFSSSRQAGFAGERPQNVDRGVDKFGRAPGGTRLERPAFAFGAGDLGGSYPTSRS